MTQRGLLESAVPDINPRACHIRFAALAPLLLMAVAASGCDNSGDDLVALRDGSSKIGKLERCDAAGCTLSGAAIARATIQSIRLGRRSALNLEDASRDEVQLTDASVVAETMMGVDAAQVTTNQETHPRDRVAWIYLAPRPPLGPQHWYGTFTWSIRQRVPSGPQDWDGRADLVLTDDGKGGLTGTFKGTQTQKLGLSKCHAETHGTLTAELTGTITGKKITVNVPNGSADWPASTPCQEGLTAGTGAPVFKWPHLDEAFRELAPAGDGSYVYDHEWTIPQAYPFILHYTVKLARAK